ncbi:hypothetical protein AAG906_013362 [Vitis piasezkii]
MSAKRVHFPCSRLIREGVCPKHYIAMARVFTLFPLALLAISMLHTIVLASHGHGGHHYDQRNYDPGSLKMPVHSPGYYGNKAVCPGYNNWKAKEGGPKCPGVVTLFTLLTHFKLA